jgi:hypothetical protein
MLALAASDTGQSQNRTTSHLRAITRYRVFDKAFHVVRQPDLPELSGARSEPATPSQSGWVSPLGVTCMREISALSRDFHLASIVTATPRQRTRCASHARGPRRGGHEHCRYEALAVR